ncbi:Mbov_0400 family ICE element protein [Mycoplasma capricolum]|uniref:Mbov_0400 family ICE element protein n=1 Tax=Mycoplasma capricolum TaxID=2095 RepID=UPI003A5C7A62
MAKNKNGSLIERHGNNRPYIIFFSDEKVFYLSAKTILDSNRKTTTGDKTNVIFKKDLYGNDREIAVNCSVINVMDRELFDSLYIKDSSFNNFQTDIEHYNKIMKKLFDVFNEIKYFEVDHIDEKTNQPIWKSDNEAIKNKKECEMVIKGYHYLIRDNKISPEIILDKPEHFFEVTKEYFNILKIHLLMKLMIMCEIINLLIEMIHLM